RRVNNIALNYNFNGIVHAGENGQPDDLNGYRSISDRGLDFTNGVPADPTLDKYNLISQAGVPDIVHLGNRNTVSGGNWAFQATPNADCTGVQPSWLADPDQTGLQTTVLADPILMDSESEASGIFHISDGGGTFDVILTFQSGFSVTATIGGGDWFGGPYPGTDSTDCGNGPAAGLHINEQTFDLSPAAGQILTSISFGNRSNGGAGYAIFAMNVAGCLSCPNSGGVTNLGGGNGPTMSTSSNGNMGCDLDWTVSGATPGSPVSVIALGIGSTSTPLGAFFPSCSGTIAIQNPVANLVAPNAQGQASVTLVIPPDTSFCGLPLTGQYAELAAAACPVLLSDALTITLGN
ncbi:MAG: hypothetical protein VYE77_07215, partial [Planctomycetota bacterium]|nr:hypothetical protein [Planctomycetota bacterium]